MIFGFCKLHFQTRNLPHYPKYQIYTLATSSQQYFFEAEFYIRTCMNSSTEFS